MNPDILQIKTSILHELVIENSPVQIIQKEIQIFNHPMAISFYFRIEHNGNVEWYGSNRIRDPEEAAELEQSLASHLGVDLQ